MATVGDIVIGITAVLLDWLSIAVIAAIIYMLFQLVTGGEGLGKLFGGGDKNPRDSNRSNRDSSNKDNNRDKDDAGNKKTGKDEAAEKAKKGKDTYTYIDPSKTAEVSVRIVDEQDRGVSRAKVTLAPNRQRIRIGGNG